MLGYFANEVFEFGAGEDCACGVIGVAQVDYFGLGCDRVGDGVEVEMIVFERNSIELDALGFDQNIESDKCTLRSEHFIIVVQEGTDDIGHGRLRAAAQGDIVHLGGKSFSQGFS
ncbi:MAG: hypothetical protein BWY75_02936 [bacterium ADurb.Bin425]|nr:MAG: hypothetical protein BWY75_02936 [bacterium ADurb.Bin425]